MRRRLFVFVATIALTAVAVALAPQGLAAPKDDLKAVRAATARFHSLERAESAGYELDPVCVESPDGGMGIHAINGPLVGDPRVDASQPEVLLYEPQPDGRLVLVGVEYLVFDADQNLATDGDRPSVLGTPFEGPMEGHGPGMPIHYDLHVWVWRDSPAGTFSTFNPTVGCP